MKTKDLTYMAFYIALFAVLEFLGVSLGLFQMPNGGTFSISEVALIMASYHLGVKKGSIVCVVGFVIMFGIKPPFVVHWFQFVLDYVLAFSVYAFVCLIPDLKIRKLSIPIGILVVTLLRYMFHNISGIMFFFDDYSWTTIVANLTYNATYLFPSLIMIFIIVLAIKQPILNFVNKK